jgi:flavin reductase (DIM6/NTAB) family NADH-FMN oxidoreductase RutF
MKIDLAHQPDLLAFYRLLAGAVVPRPIAFVSTLSSSGRRNLAPFSFFNVASIDPPVLCFSPLLKTNGAQKDTLRNIEETRQFVVNIVSDSFVAKMNATSAEVPPDVDEFLLSGLTPKPSELVAPPGVAESHVQLECRLRDVIRFGDHAHAGNLVLGDILMMHIDDAVVSGGLIDRAKLAAVGRMAGQTYARTTDCFDLTRPA